MSARPSGGLLMYRMREGKPEVFIVHPGGPFWQKRDEGVWSIPKGEINPDEEDIFAAAKREFAEETGFALGEGDYIPLGEVRRKDGKVVTVWAFEGDGDPSKMACNTIFIEWPPKSGRKIEIPECDRGNFFDTETAKWKVVSYQKPLIEAFERLFGK